jgi:hypothetical protein
MGGESVAKRSQLPEEIPRLGEEDESFRLDPHAGVRLIMFC